MFPIVVEHLSVNQITEKGRLDGSVKGYAVEDMYLAYHLCPLLATKTLISVEVFIKLYFYARLN